MREICFFMLTPLRYSSARKTRAPNRNTNENDVWMNTPGTRFLRGLYRAALAAVDPRHCVSVALAEPAVARALRDAPRVGIFAAGKAAAGMFDAAAAAGREALVVLPRGHPAPSRPGATVLFSAHPEPDASSVAAARAAVRFFSGFGRGDVVLCLVSGGTSSVLCLPRPGVTLAQKKRAVARLVRAGAPIREINRLRTSLSAVKGGKLGRTTAARLVTLVLSDVRGDRPSLVGSGPTVRGRRGDLVRVVGSNRVGVEAAIREARRRGYRAQRERRRLEGEARLAGRRLAAKVERLSPGEAIFAGGETTVTLGRSAGKGGRNLEVALSAAVALEGVAGATLLAAGSDGKDGSSRATGAFADGVTIARGRRAGADASSALARHDTEPYFARAGGLLVTGPTGTNVGDWAFGVRVLETTDGRRKTVDAKRKK
jgi:glycerate 2-kinase